MSQPSTIAHYRIISKLGEGGMGVVYRATDTKLNREVAIKILPEAFAQEADRMARFQREAHVLASLNHPNIAQIYGVEERALVMELVEGEPLRAPLPMETALDCSRQIANALAAAHDRGITHRDLKPANIMVTPQGVVKVLDFGLAAVAQKSFGDPTTSPTLTISPTRAGMILGTAAYMSPEQARGKPVDKRADIWTFGVVLYEMLTGERLFRGETVSDTLAAVLKTDPDWSVLPNRTPLEIRRLLRRCLERDPQRRLHDIADARIEIEDALEQPQMPADPAPKKQLRLAWIAAVSLLLGVLGGWLLWHNRSPAYHESAARLQFQLPEGGRFIAPGAFAGGLAVSPDGQTAAFVAVVDGTAGLWVRSLGATQARLLPGTAGATGPFWSPDSKTLAFFSFGRLQALDIARGTSSKICDVNGVFVGGAWSNDGRILLAIRDVGIFQVPAAGGSPSPFTTVDHAHGEISHAAPQILPDGKFLYGASIDREAPAVYAAPLQNPSRRVRLLAAPLSGFTYARASDGEDYLLWIQGTTLVAQQLDVDKLRLSGDTISLADPVAAVSAGSGVLVYAASVALRQFRWFDRAGKDGGALGEPHDYVFCRISPDGRRAATVYAGAAADIWLLETARGVASRLTSRGIHIMPVWSPDGRTILFGGGQPFNLFRIPADGSGAEERIVESKNGQGPMDWSRDGRLVLYNDQAPDTDRDIWTVEVTPDGKLRPGASPRPYIVAPFNQVAGRFSPDTRWVAYQSDDSGRAEVYVQSFPEPGERFRISTTGGRYPEWGPEGRELFYVSPDEKLMAVTVKAGTGSLEASLPRELFQLPSGVTGYGPYELDPNGQRFLVPVVAGKVEPLSVIVNWPALLKKGPAAR